MTRLARRLAGPCLALCMAIGAPALAQNAPTKAVAAAAMHYRVLDEQLRVDERSQEESVHVVHVVRVVNEPAGLQAASQIELEFDPGYQTLALHHVDVIRAGQRSAWLSPQRVQLLQRETQLERRRLAD